MHYYAPVLSAFDPTKSTTTD